MRASWNKGLKEFIIEHKPDVLALQEIKVLEEQLEEEQKNPNKMHSFWYSAKKPGYSGVCTYTRQQPKDVIYGIGNATADSEGRVLTLEFADFYYVNAYFPNSQRDHARLDFKIEFCEDIQNFLKKLNKKKHVVLCGDYNVAHKEIDLKNPKSNTKTAGFLPEERAWMDRFLSDGFVDLFRAFEEGGGHYTWWSYRPGVRDKNVGWRIDYHCADREFLERVQKAKIYPEVKGSDHCPIEIVVS